MDSGRTQVLDVLFPSSEFGSMVDFVRLSGATLLRQWDSNGLKPDVSCVPITYPTKCGWGERGSAAKRARTPAHAARRPPRAPHRRRAHRKERGGGTRGKPGFRKRFGFWGVYSL